jgi:hypothetical protein
MRAAAGLIAAFALAALSVAGQDRARSDPHRAFDLNRLPGFDAHVYVAMAEEPSVFTLAPWGYRILEPMLVGALFPPARLVDGFASVARASLVAAGTLLFVYLRTLRVHPALALLGVPALILSAPAGATFENPFLVEPFALMLWLAALTAVERTRGDARVSGACLAVLSLAKEVWVLALPIVFVARDGDLAARARRTALAVAPCAALALLLRIVWRPSAAGPPSADPMTDPFAAFAALSAGFPVWGRAFLLDGITVVALLALARPAARAYLRRHAVTLLGAFALPLAASVYTGAGAATSFFAADIERLLVYALPLVIALAAHAAPPAVADPAGVATARATPRWALGAMAVLFVVAATRDPYRRADLRGARDGPYVLGFVRESLRTARRIERGETVTFDPAERRFAWGVSPPEDLRKLRFFLGAGFGPLAHYGLHDIRMREPRALLFVPSPDARDLALTLRLDGRDVAWLKVRAEGATVGEILIGPQPVTATVTLPARTVRRGDNAIELLCDDAARVQPRLIRIDVGPASR